MRIEAIFSSSGAPKLLMKPDSDGEKRLLASVLDEQIVGTVEVRHEGHFTHGRAELVSITLAAPAPQPAIPSLSDQVQDILTRYERHAHRMGELWERCQGKGWPDVEGAEFEKLRDETVPALKAELCAVLAA